MTDPSRVRISGSLQPFAAGFGYGVSGDLEHGFRRSGTLVGA